ncbi:hypothetical protein KJS94_15045 [Flavihumibacter rivuli]|uniref:hypothetical protein n=1 Tax=Flavihumibacter rivuli TaxID=2838156 RepID=UPI001BDE27C2|nr:hypothetical protein [Flavihumibacter rivuli]ULQ55965.1 hypothetical protein KJS94_15045 [Flavihumibacter rivuli]
MALLLMIAVLLLSLWTWICYLLIKFIAGIIGNLLNPNLTVNNTAVFAVSFFVAGISLYFILFSTPAKNYKTAYIENQQGVLKVTVKGKRVLMAHDPISAFLRQTYEDSLTFLLPRNKGVIQSNEIKELQGRYKPTGTISIDKDEMSIKLYYDNEQTDPYSWNGKYNLQFR